VTIRPGDPWARQVPRPDGLRTVDSDRAVVEALADNAPAPVAVGSGDLARTLGVSTTSGRQPLRDTMNELPIDLVTVTLDDGVPHTACAHVVARSPWHRGSWWRGPILAVMNAEFIGDWDVAPRGHPNDGRVEVFEVDPSMSLRDRLAARRRLRSGGHIPHPHITTRSVRTHTWTFPHRLDVIVDGDAIGRATTITVTVVPDAAVVYA
jgi:hypothetical protein